MLFFLVGLKLLSNLNYVSQKHNKNTLKKNIHSLCHLFLFTEHGDESKPEVGKLIKKEHREVGSVSIRVYLSHIRACGIPFALFSVLTLLTNQTLLVSTNIWVSHWASKSTEFVKSGPYNSTQVSCANITPDQT
jgi:hypothetical protein